MASYTDPPEEGRGRRDLTVALGFFFLSAVALYLPGSAQSQVAEALRRSVLRPFIATQEAIAQARLRAEDALSLQAQLDSLASVVAAQAPLLEENKRLREHLELQDRSPGTFIHANLIRPGTTGSESMFILDIGADQGIRPGDPVLMRIGRIGLVGVIREVASGAAIGIDWSHPDFSASAMTADGEVFGFVEPRRGDFRGGDRLLLTAIPYYERLDSGTLITTTGQGGVFPRGIPIGTVLELHEDFGDWRSEYLLKPIVETGSATHVLVVRADPTVERLIQLLEGGAEGAPEGGGDGG
ncbi:MAG: rod shape-determining protein MreC [Gemmatimonadetes bacterium]|nr:rod shape-determining protein MreC [Gemmatimonadota bacterium]NNM05523.1 rod shape-determining protein MreC [Gemmatimonadota bacterium]